MEATALSLETQAQRRKWDLRYLGMAEYISTFSKDPSTKTGAVIVDPNGGVVSQGFNGLPQKIEDLPERLENRELKYKLIIHCEMNAAGFANRSLKGCTLYTWPFMSCIRCAVHMIQLGIERCVAPVNDNPRWQEDFALSTQMFKEAGVDLYLLDLQGKSILWPNQS
jgi:dCMP deaminase